LRGATRTSWARLLGACGGRRMLLGGAGAVTGSGDRFHGNRDNQCQELARLE
jgi:hypothetical protein